MVSSSEEAAVVSSIRNSVAFISPDAGTNQEIHCTFSDASCGVSEQKQSSKSFFAVCVPPPNNGGGVSNGTAVLCGDATTPAVAAVEGAVFERLEEALAFVRNFKDRGVRFKQFRDLYDADAYVRFGHTGSHISSDSASSPNLGFVAPGSPYPAAPGSPKGVGKPPSLVEDEKPLPFVAPSRQDLLKLRRCIEKKEISDAADLIQSNPRLLVNCKCGDAPTILHEGCRYNALHIAAKTGSIDMCKTIMDAVTSVKFLSRLYPEDTGEFIQTRCKILSDAYLNSPDKAANQTPLHFAVKMGQVEVVEYLLLQPGISKDVKNRYDETPAELCQNNQYTSKATMRTILALLNDDFLFVPLYRAVDNSVPPLVRSPCNAQRLHLETLNIVPSLSAAEVTEHDKQQHAFDAKTKTGFQPKPDAQHVVGHPSFLAAYIGPCTSEVAAKVYKEWTGVKLFSRAVIDLKRSDVTKGLERVGRGIADKYGVNWVEFWPFLGVGWIDLREAEGLLMLERYLTDINAANKKRETPSALFSPDDNNLAECTSSKSVSAFVGKTPEHSILSSTGFFKQPPETSSPASPFLGLCRKHLDFSFDEADSDRSSEKSCERNNNSVLAASPLMSTGAAGFDVGEQKVSACLAAASQPLPSVLSVAASAVNSSVKCTLRSPISCLPTPIPPQPPKSKNENLVLQEVPISGKQHLDLMSPDSKNRSGDNLLTHLCDVQSVCLSLSGGSSDLSSLCGQLQALNLASFTDSSSGSDSGSTVSGVCRLGLDDAEDVFDCVDTGDADDMYEFAECDDNQDFDEQFEEPLLVSSPSVMVTLPVTPEMEGETFETPPDSPTGIVYILGSRPSKLDLDAFIALESTYIDPLLYPMTYRWRQSVAFYPQEDQQKWPNFDSPRAKTCFGKRPISFPARTTTTI